MAVTKTHPIKSTLKAAIDLSLIHIYFVFRKPFLDFAHTHAANKHSENLFDNRRGFRVKAKGYGLALRRKGRFVMDDYPHIRLPLHAPDPVSYTHLDIVYRSL